jgi:hypothetical protein
VIIACIVSHSVPVLDDTEVCTVVRQTVVNIKYNLQVKWANFLSLGLHGKSYEWVYQSIIFNISYTRCHCTQYCTPEYQVLAWDVLSFWEWGPSPRTFGRLIVSYLWSQFFTGGSYTPADKGKSTLSCSYNVYKRADKAVLFYHLSLLVKIKLNPHLSHTLL